MSGSVTRPDYGAAIADLARRLGILERRTTPKPPDIPVGHTHDGAGAYSTILHESVEVTPAEASGDQSVAAGAAAKASGESATAVGYNARALGSNSAAFGEGTYAAGDFAFALGPGAAADGIDSVAIGEAAAYADNAVAIGSNTVAYGAQSVALGSGALTTNDNQIMLGASGGYAPRVVQGAPDGAIDAADLAGSQLSFYLNEAGSLLVVKVKYSDGSTVKTGTIALT